MVPSRQLPAGVTALLAFMAFMALPHLCSVVARRSMCCLSAASTLLGSKAIASARDVYCSCGGLRHVYMHVCVGVEAQLERSNALCLRHCAASPCSIQLRVRPPSSAGHRHAARRPHTVRHATYLQHRLSPSNALHGCCVAALGPWPEARAAASC